MPLLSIKPSCNKLPQKFQVTLLSIKSSWRKITVAGEKVLLRRCGAGGVQQHHYLFTRGYALLLHHLEDLLLVIGVVQALVVEVFVVAKLLLLLIPVLLATRGVLVLLYVRAHFIGLVLLPLALRHCWVGGREESKGPVTHTH